ncbi:alpha/beta hydrolase fold domain-containing protein [Erythrobacter sp. MTPC3]|uniref:alpha/beta hydrolase fold domain-containing protein n=1 Tax=Erythrobacter sp. MTPC3 TaxID=3056564 RepID=UPI0036F3CD75
MLTDTTTELRTTRPSLLLRGVKWVMARRKSVFPHTATEFEALMATRDLPRDAAMPTKFETKYRVHWWEAAGQKTVTLHPRSGPGEWHMIYFHGGGFVLPMFKEHWPLVEAMIEQLGVSVTLPLYDVVPEASYSAQDALADEVFAKVSAEHDPAKIVLNGDSAGGHMALSLALRMVRAGGTQPGKLALFAPWLDLTMADEAMKSVEPHDIMLKIGTLRSCGQMLAGDGDPADPQFSPLYTPAKELALLPPTRIWTGRHDLFIIDSRSFAGRLRDAGVDAKLYEYEAAPHVFMAITPTKESRDTLSLLKEFLQN